MRAPGVPYTEAGALVTRTGSDLTGACIKCGNPDAPHRRVLNLSYIPPVVYLAILASLPVFILVALLTRKKSDHLIALCDTCQVEWDHSLKMTTASAFSIIGSVFASGALIATNAVGAALAIGIGGPAMGVAGLIVAARRRLRARRIDGQATRIDGVGAGYHRRAQALLPAPTPHAAPPAGPGYR